MTVTNPSNDSDATSPSNISNSDDNVESKEVLKSAELLGAALQKELEYFGLSVVSRSLLDENNDVTLMILLKAAILTLIMLVLHATKYR